MPSSVKILKIVGAGRSGSTIISNIIGQIPGAFAVGELQYLWMPGYLEQILCACGQTVTQCAVWSAIFKQAFGDVAGVDRERLHALYLQNTRGLSGMSAILRSTARKPQPLLDYLAYLERFYAAIAAVTGCHLIIDEAKHPTYSVMLDMIPGLQCYTLHLVRDARAVVYSMQRKIITRTTQGQVSFMINSASRTSRDWIVSNVLAEWLGRMERAPRLFMRYEDFARHPEALTRQLLGFIEEPADLCPVHGHAVDISDSHIFASNPVRFARGNVEIRLDDDWQRELKARDKALTTALTLPLLWRYHYPVRAQHK